MTELAVALQAKSAADRWLAIKKINENQSRLIDASGLSLLGQALADAHPFVRWQAGLALTRQAEGQQKLVEILNGAESTLKRSAAADALRQCRLSGIDASLVNALRAEAPALRQSAAEALATQKAPEALPHLLNAIKDSSFWVRRAAAYALGHLGNGEAAPALILALRDKTVIVRRSAAYALGALRAKTAAPQLKRLLNDKDPLTRRNAAWALGRIGQKDAIPDLTRLLNDSAGNGTVAAAAGQAIEMITKPRWLQLLLGVKGRFRR